MNSKWVLQTLILSVALNGALLCTFFYFLIRDNPLHLAYQPKEEREERPPPITPTLLGRLHTLPVEQLKELLQDQRKIQHGYRVRDFALGALASFHDVDVERGVGKGKLAKRKWEYGGDSFLLFPGLQDADFDQLQTFVAEEKWPLTPRGLFRLLRSAGVDKSDPALVHFFCHTPHFILLETLFARTELPIKKRSVLAVALESGWENLETYYEKQQTGTDFSDAIRQKFLVDAITEGSKTAVYLLLITDSTFACEELEDGQVVHLLELLTIKTQEAMQFAKLIVESPRSDSVRYRALERLSDFTGRDLAGHFYEKPGLKKLRPVFREQPPAAPEPSTHIVQPGESLWLIARKYQVTLEKLMESNHLQSTSIRPGKSLKIPR